MMHTITEAAQQGAQKYYFKKLNLTVTLSPTSSFLPQALMTKGSLTDMHATVSTPLLLNSSTSEIKPGKCDSEHVGVIAPGTPHTTTCVVVEACECVLGTMTIYSNSDYR
jgi:hypothetical protein